MLLGEQELLEVLSLQRVFEGREGFFPVLTESWRPFHHRETRHEKTLDCCVETGGFIR